MQYPQRGWEGVKTLPMKGYGMFSLKLVMNGN